MITLNPFELAKIKARFFEDKYFATNFKNDTMDETVWLRSLSAGGAGLIIFDGNWAAQMGCDGAVGNRGAIQLKNFRVTKSMGAMTFEAELFANPLSVNSVQKFGLTGNIATEVDQIVIRNTGATTWVAECSKNDATTATAITNISDAWHKVRIEINAAWTSVKFYIDDALEQTITTNIPNDLVLHILVGAFGITAPTAAHTIYCRKVKVSGA